MPSRPPDIWIERSESPDHRSSELAGGLRLSRSPRPYHHKTLDSDADGITTGLRSANNEQLLQSPEVSRPNTPSEFNLGLGDVEYEGFRRTRALPAPFVRPRKGLIGGTYAEDDLTSSFPTPSPSEAENDHRSGQYFTGPDSGKAGEKEQPKRRTYKEKLTREVSRRVAEISSLMLIGKLVLSNSSVSEVPGYLVAVNAIILVTLMVLYLLYILGYHVVSDLQLRLGKVKLPSRLDPAVLLYPVFLPLFVASSIAGTSEAVLIANAILGVSSLPRWLFPAFTRHASLDVCHWTASCLPLLFSKTIRGNIPGHLGEAFVLLFPLHRALLASLRYLTTTSLLPSELHLLASAMINLLLFSQSPPMIILKILLWYGGVGLLAACTRSSRRIVALERIPRTNFTPVDSFSKPTRDFWVSLAHGFGITSTLPPTKLPTAWTASEARRSKLGDPDSVTVRPITGISRTKTMNYGHQRGAASVAKIGVARRVMNLRRSKSLPTKKVVGQYVKRVQPLTSLTTLELKAQSLLFNIYTYIIIFSLVLGPIRIEIARRALGGREPFLWAIGYLFGDIKSVQVLFDDFGVRESIGLPPSTFGSVSECWRRQAWVQCMRTEYIGTANTRLLLFAYWATIIAMGVATVMTLSASAEVDTRRKVFHGTMVIILLPTAFIDPQFLALGLVLVLAVFLLLDMIRASLIKPLSRPLAVFLQPYVDGRDLCGPVIVSHIFLLIGCAIPFWLSLAGVQTEPSGPWSGWETGSRDVSMIAGVVCVGMGDAAASLIGRRFGRHKWAWSGGKSLEGSAAFAVAVALGLLAGRAWLQTGGWTAGQHGEDEGWATVVLKVVAAGCGASFTEAVLTGCNDNVVVPVILWLLVRGLHV